MPVLRSLLLLAAFLAAAFCPKKACAGFRQAVLAQAQSQRGLVAVAAVASLQPELYDALEDGLVAAPSSIQPQPVRAFLEASDEPRPASASPPSRSCRAPPFLP